MMDFEKQVSEFRAGSHFFARGRPVFIGRAPVRLALVCGNGDYTGGLVFEATIREATWAAVQLRPDRRVGFWNPQVAAQGWRERPEFELDDLVDEETVRRMVNRDPSLRWTAYVLGIFYLLRLRYPEAVTSGANVYIYSEVPLNKGVSSSAAVVELEGAEQNEGALDTEALRAYCRANLARYKVPEVFLVSTLPRNAMGKTILGD